MSYEKCKQAIVNKYPDSSIASSFELPSGYLFSLKPKSWGKDEYVLDGLFKVTLDGTITEYSPVINPEEFKRAMRSRVE